MRLTACLLALLAAVSSSPYVRESKWSLIFSDGTGREVALTRRRGNTADCVDKCDDTLSDESDDEWRLSNDVTPTLYNLQLDVQLEKFRFTGTAYITMTAQRPTQNITLHSDGLRLIGFPEIFMNEVTEKLKWGTVHSVVEDTKHFTLAFMLDKVMETDNIYIIRIEYRGKIREDLYGFYRSSYTVGNETRWLATTHFEPTHARRAFPCFDEPNIRAEFDISITHDEKYSALSNMPVKQSVSKNGRVTDTFQRTKKMSTYLVAFVVSDFKSYKTNDPISSVYASEDLIKDAEYSQRTGVEAVKEMEKFTNIKFSLPKIDHVAIPDFPIGAMENWGLITYRDYLLIKTNDSTTPDKLKISTLISHEVSHQWFGNLVSINWWSYAWLKEGFATFLEYYVTEQITQGKFSLWDQFIPDAFQVALDVDGNPATSFAMTSKVSTPEEISAKFNAITYEKAGTVLRMISEVLTIEKFRDGLRSYLKENQYSSTKPEDLFQQWKKVSSGALPQDINFTDFAKSWTEQGGVPVVTVIRDYETGNVTFSQQRYYEKKSRCTCGQNRRWWIPLTWVTQNESSTIQQFKPDAWLLGDIQDEKLVKEIDVTPREWLLINFRSIGYFRVNYDVKNWQLLTKALTTNPQLFPIQNRAQLINDAFHLASSSHLDFAVALDTLNYLSMEESASVWKSACKIISKLVDELGHTYVYSWLEQYWRGILTDVYSEVGLKPNANEEHDTSLLRFHVAYWACRFGVQQCVKDATENLESHIDELNSIHPDVVAPTLCGAIRGATEQVFWDIRKKVATASRNKDKMHIISALGKCHLDNHLIKRHLQESLQQDSIIPKDFKQVVIQQVLVVPSKFRVGFDFVKANLVKLLKTVGKKDTTSLVVTLIKKLRTDSEYQEVSRWLRANLHRLYDPKNVTAELSASKSNTEWNTLHFTNVAKWFATSTGHEITTSNEIEVPQTYTEPPTKPSPENSAENHVAFITSAVFMCSLSFVCTCIFYPY